MSAARKILSNTASQVGAKAITALLGVASVKLVTNYLSESVYGEYTAIYDYVAIFAIIADFGLFTIAIREMSHDEKRIPVILGNVLSIRTILGVIALGLGTSIAFFVPAYKDSFIPLGVGLVSVSVLLTLISGTISSVLQVHLRMHWAAYGLVIGKLVTVAYIAASILYFYPKNPDAGVLPDAGFFHLIYAWIIGTLLSLLIVYFSSRKLVKIRYRLDFDFWKEVIFKALPYGIALLLGSLYFRTGSVVMSFFGQKEEVGIYGVAMRFAEISTIIPAYFMNSVLPILTRALKESFEKAKKILQHSFDFMALVAFPMLAGGFVLAKPIIAGISNESFLSYGGVLRSDFVLSILLFGMVFTFFYNIFNFTLIALGLQRKILIVNFFAALINIAANIILIPRYSYIAVAVIAVFTEFFIFCFSFYWVRSLLQFRPKILLAAKGLIASLLMAFVVWFLDLPMREVMGLKSLFLLIPIGGLFYFATLIFLRTFTPEMIEVFFKKKGKEAASDQMPNMPEL